MKKLFLFDMDGTLTTPRGKMSWPMVSILTLLQNKNWDVGIISGSDLDYIHQQCDIILDMSPFNARECHFLPCNGTKYYLNFKKVWEHSMKKQIGQYSINMLMKALFKEQRKIIKKYDIPLTGNFIQQRGSMINWCPIGRNANQVERKLWVKLDEKYKIRIDSLRKIKKHTENINITIKLGGETSFDIYPNGWNKTFPLYNKPFKDYEKIYFLGDKCNTNGNDKEIFDMLNKSTVNKGYETNNPKNTMEIVEKIISEES
jgi:phosphomannomutase